MTVLDNSQSDQGDTAISARRRGNHLSVGTLVFGVAFWIVGLLFSDGEMIPTAGFLGALHWSVLVGALLVLASFVYSLSRRQLNTDLILVQTGAMLLILFASGPLLEPVLSNHVAWRHLGIARHIAELGIDPSIDAYFNWPGFFAGAAVFGEALGYDILLILAPWNPVLMNAAYLVPVLVLARHATADRRVPWLAAWIFMLGNWVSQDYFSPQAFAYLGSLVIATLLVVVLADQPRPTRSSSVSGDTQRLTAVIVILVIFSWIVVSHQLTPFAVLAFTLILTIARPNIPRYLIVVMVVIQITWLSFFADEYLSSNLSTLTDQFGRLGELAEAGVTSRLSGSESHAFAVRMRIASAAFLGLLGLAGWVFTWRAERSSPNRGRHISLGLLGISPVGVLIAASYGGEMMLRAYLFTLPILAIYTAILLGAPTRRNVQVLTMSIVLVALLAMFPITRYGNAEITYFSEVEVTAVEATYEDAEEGDVLISITTNLPWKYDGYASYEYRTISNLDPIPDLDQVPRLTALALDQIDASGYIIVTRSQIAYSEAFGLWTEDEFEQLRNELVTRPDYAVIYSAPEAIVARYG